MGIGEALLLTSVFSILPHYFNKRIGLANGVENFIGALILAAVPFIVSYSISSLGLSSTFFVLSALFMISGLCALTFAPELPVPVESNWRIRVKSSIGLEVFKKPKFIIWCFSGFVGYLGFAMPLITIVSCFFFVYFNHDITS